ncbi:hypothetical protein PPTG_15604 [Phytophthora nicotianae INRA-310]|uniref:RxLR effector protein n=1 Tax=Phytophthora nicotianae (strain INRA-310) TaxID=761204 RepID=W2PTR1_PHYN3|nr:hypothetical protein PPTG_15604 [Phytophthora nicotianae INRA-310]ETN03629.1 hypothetical protein PPTG_15604 [Phytophthora nicotianae INRA-310]
MSAAASSDQSIIYTGRKLRTEMRSNEDRMINLSAQSAKSVTLGALNNIDVASLRTTAIPDTAFTMLKLDQAGDDLFKSPQFLNWIQRYSSDKNARSDKENPGNGKDRNEITKEPWERNNIGQYLRDFLRRRSGGKGDRGSEKVESTEEFAKDLQVALFSQWMWEGAQPKQIWKMLHLEKSTDPNGGDLAWL